MDLRTIESLAPDQASLTAASKLRKPGKWPLRAQESGDDSLVWGECQGSGSNPYRVVFDAEEVGYKCTCPSRKFPCKHVLALMWMFTEDPAAFGESSVPDWVTDWMGRRRKTTTEKATGGGAPGEAKSLTRATLEEAKDPKPVDPKKKEQQEKAAKTRAEQTHRMILDSLGEFEGWVGDQLRMGLAGFLGEYQARCRRIASRLVDGRAAMLASRMDELPAKLAALSREDQLNTTIHEFSKMLVLARAYRAQPEKPEIRAAVATAMVRDDVLAHADAEAVEGVWEVLASLIHTQRDGLVRESSWLMRIKPEPVRFALLMDHYPASAGKRAGGFEPGDQLEAMLRYYPAERPLRAIIESRQPVRETREEWPQWEAQTPLAAWLHWFEANPWGEAHPVLLHPGRIGRTPGEGQFWWQGAEGEAALPLSMEPHTALLGSELKQSVALWDGRQARLLAARTEFGTCHLS